MHESRRLIINADDFGISRGVNQGIVEAAQAGGITSTSLMVNMPASQDAVARIRECGGISVGLHFNLTVGNALTGVSSLTQGQTSEFYPLPKLLAAASIGMLEESDIERECLAQIDRMTRSGFPPTHLDSHRHVHSHPAIYPAVMRAVQARRIPQMRVPCERLDVNVRAWRATLKKGMLLLSAHRSRRLQPGELSSGLALPNIGFVGISLQGGASFRDRLFALIRELPSGTTELMTHPGYADAALATCDRYTVERETELRVLCSGEFRELLQSNRITLASFSEQRPIGRAHQQVAEYC